MFLEFYVFGERVIGWVRGGVMKYFISFEGGIKYFSMPLGGAKFYGRILEYPQPPPPPLHRKTSVPFSYENYRFSKTVLYIINGKIHGCLELPDLFLVFNMIYHLFNTLYLLTTLNISIQTMDCNNFQNSYVLRILCFWGEGDWLGAGGGGGGCQILWYNFGIPSTPPSTHTLWPVPYIVR
jgi:hypothetical protein